jgi:hypothetical protein
VCAERTKTWSERLSDQDRALLQELHIAATDDEEPTA